MTKRSVRGWEVLDKGFDEFHDASEVAYDFRPRYGNVVVKQSKRGDYWIYGKGKKKKR